MLIALLAVLGVDLVVLVAFAALVLGRRRWLKRQPGEFAGAIRVTSGEINGLGRSGSTVRVAGSATSWSGAEHR
jgi:ABC-type transporter Mla subunit MlaD